MPIPMPTRESESPLTMTIPTGQRKLSGSCLWKWVAPHAKWVMLEDRSEPGFEPGTGPGQPGRFNGQIVRWSSVAVAGCV